MEAKELRIGNLLLTDYDYLVEVEFIHKNHFDCRELTTGSFVVNGKYKPIPLTEEWLVKFGYRWTNGYGYRFLKGWIKLKEGVWKSYDLEAEVKYVHELQNLYYALTKKELTIKK